MKRRTFVGGAVSAAVVGGCPAPPPPAPQVQFVGQSAERGHAIRDGALRIDNVDERVRTGVLVVGAGVAGASACWRLARAGRDDVMLLELEEENGGTARAGAMSRSAYPMGAHYLPSPHPGFALLHTLLEDLGVILGRDRSGTPDYDPAAICRGPVERHRNRGRWDDGIYPALGQTADEEAQWLRWREHLRELDRRDGSDGRRLFDLPVSSSSADLRHLDAISMATYLDRLGLDSWRLRWAVDYACRDDYGCTLAETSAFAGLHHYLARGLEDEHDRVLLVWPQGNAHLVEAMIDRAQLGERRRTNHAVVRIDPDTGLAHAYDVVNDRVVAIEAETILWAAPRFVLRHVLPADPLPATALSYVPWLVANVELDRPPGGIGAPLSWDNVAVDSDHLGYVVATHNQPLTASTDPRTVVTFYKPFTAATPAELGRRRGELLAGTAAQWAAQVTDALEQMHPGIAPSMRRIDVARWGHAMIRPVPGLLFSPELAQARSAVGRVLPCAADVGGLPLFEQAFSLGVRAAESALARS